MSCSYWLICILRYVTSVLLKMYFGINVSSRFHLSNISVIGEKVSPYSSQLSCVLWWQLSHDRDSESNVREGCGAPELTRRSAMLSARCWVWCVLSVRPSVRRSVGLKICDCCIIIHEGFIFIHPRLLKCTTSRCGSGLSGDYLSEEGHFWLGVDISTAMLGWYL